MPNISWGIKPSVKNNDTKVLNCNCKSSLVIIITLYKYLSATGKIQFQRGSLKQVKF